MLTLPRPADHRIEARFVAKLTADAVVCRPRRGQPHRRAVGRVTCQESPSGRSSRPSGHLDGQRPWPRRYRGSVDEGGALFSLRQERKATVVVIHSLPGGVM